MKLYQFNLIMAMLMMILAQLMDMDAREAYAFGLRVFGFLYIVLFFSNAIKDK